jgi:antitoxin component YwqK of YwqJK toxin-antitoxin module
VESYTRDGRRISEIRDEDEDGVIEALTNFRTDGSRTIWHDDDQDGELNGFVGYAPAGRRVSEGNYADGGIQRTATAWYPDGHWCLEKDLDGDGLFDLREIYDESGLLVRRQVDRGLEGFVDEK